MVVVPEGQTLFSVGDIATELLVPVSRVVYVIRTRHIKPAGRAGTTRLFTEANREQIRNALKGIDARREPLEALEL